MTSGPMGMAVTVYHYQMIDPRTGRAEHPLATLEYRGLREGSKVLYNKIKSSKVIKNVKIFCKKSNSGAHQMEMAQNQMEEVTKEESRMLAKAEVCIEENPSNCPGITRYLHSSILKQYPDRYVCAKVKGLKVDTDDTSASPEGTQEPSVELRHMDRREVGDYDPIQAAKRSRQPIVLDDYHRIARGITDGNDDELGSQTSSIDADDEASSVIRPGSYPIEQIRSISQGSVTSRVGGEVNSSEKPSLGTSTSYRITYDTPPYNTVATQRSDTFLYGNTLASSEEHRNSATASPSSSSDNNVYPSAMVPPHIFFGPEPLQSLTLNQRASTSSASSAMASVTRAASRSLSIQNRLSSDSIFGLNQRLRLNGVASADYEYNLRSEIDIPDHASIRSNNSVIYLGLDDLMEQHPEFTEELTVLKKSIGDHVRNLRRESIFVTKSLEQQIDELCEILSQKDDQLKQNIALIENAYRKVDVAEAHLEASKDELKQSDVSRDIWEHEYRLKAREVDIERRVHNSKVINLEREKRTLIEKLQCMEAKLETERVRANGPEQAKATAMASVEGMRNKFDFYRNYYDGQAGVHGQYFPNGSSSTDSKDKGNGRELELVGADSKTLETRSDAIHQATQQLRETYIRMLDSEGGQRMSGIEFLAQLELERSSGAKNTHDTALKNDEDEVEVEGFNAAAAEAGCEANTSFTSHFLSTEH